MAFLLGTDEAGYGPNLGPLVISITAWETPDGVGAEQLFDRLANVVAQKPIRGCPRIVIGDSKTLYNSGKGLRLLERGLWPALALLNQKPRTWRDVWTALAPEAIGPMEATPWYTGFDRPTPRDCPLEEIESLVEPFRAGLAAAGVRLHALASRVILAEEFNRLVAEHGSKGEALSHETLALAARTIAALPPGPVSATCDKHGGRNRYAPVLARHFAGEFIEVRDEGRQRSEYRFGPPARRIAFCFRAKGEGCLPVALASMASKYLRESAMLAFNDFWASRVPGLRPTAGYPVDAKRFRLDIAETRQRLGIDDRILWRVK